MTLSSGGGSGTLFSYTISGRLNLLVYGNLVHAPGYETFCDDAAAAGASSLLVPDIPLEGMKNPKTGQRLKADLDSLLRAGVGDALYGLRKGR